LPTENKKCSDINSVDFVMKPLLREGEREEERERKRERKRER
jgi:hypothetical protein